MTAESPQATVSCPSDTTKGLCDRPLETFARSPLQLCGALRWQVAAALSAAVTTTKQQETTLQLAAAYCMEEKQLEPQLLFGRGGLGERRFS